MGIEKKVSGEFKRIRSVAVGIVLSALIVGSAGSVVYGLLFNSPISETKFNRRYNQLLLRYADKNHNNKLTASEIDSFFTNEFYNGRNVIYLHDRLPISIESGEEISKETMFRWIKEYECEHPLIK